MKKKFHQFPAMFLLFLSLLLTSCSVFKSGNLLKNDSSSWSSSVGTSVNNSRLRSGIHQTHVQSDSSEEQLIAEIIPRGEFSYSPASGFKGSAASIIIRGDNKKETLVKDSTSLYFSTDSSSARFNRRQQRSSVKSKSKKIKKRSFNLLLPGFIALGVATGGGVAVYKKLQNRQKKNKPPI